MYGLSGDESKSIFLKLHYLLAHITKLAQELNMIGILSKESFEVVHHQLETIYWSLSTMTDSKKYIQKIIKRILVEIDADVDKVQLDFKKKTTGAKQGHYRANSTIKTENIDIAPCFTSQSVRPGLVLVHDKNVIKE